MYVGIDVAKAELAVALRRRQPIPEFGRDPPQDRRALAEYGRALSWRQLTTPCCA